MDTPTYDFNELVERGKPSELAEALLDRLGVEKVVRVITALVDTTYEEA